MSNIAANPIAVTPIAVTTKGKVEGRIKDDVVLFAGIPYAAPPLGERRFKDAVAHEAWEGTRSATKFGFAAPQVPSGGLTDSAPVNWSEDCLTLNVSTPALDNQKRPVMVWIHGGGYRTGQGAIPWYNGARFSKNGDIVVVSINYRLGALGFTDLSRFGPEYANSGINGILDQIKALEWVRDNIENFGGDPEQVTIAGESAGGFSVATLLGSPRAAGLFRRAIPQSGAAHHTLTPEAAKKVTDLFLDAMQSESIDNLNNATVDQVLEAQQAVDNAVRSSFAGRNSLGGFVAPFYPVVGGEVLPQDPLIAIRSGQGADVAVLTGSNTDETTLWGYGEVSEEKLQRVAEELGGGESLLSAYRAEKPEAGLDDLMIAITTDHSFRIPAIRLAEAREAGGNTWMYEFCWNSRAMGGRLKATHSLEIPFAFDNLDKSGVDFFLGEGESPQHVADLMHTVWTEFIRHGDPGWMAYNSERRATMCFDDESTLQENPSAISREAWQGIR
jgi:para-nitrobenzyl esterase